MPLFHHKVLNKHLKNQINMPMHHYEILSQWSKNLEQGIYDIETQNDGEFIQRILIEVLGYQSNMNGLEWTIAKNQPVGKGNVDVALGAFTNDSSLIQAPLELKGAKTRDLDAIMPGRNKTPVQQAWEYAMDAKGSQWVLVSNYREIRLYAVGYGRKDYEVFDLSKLTDLESYNRFMLLLSAENLLNGVTFSFLKESEQVEKGITDDFYREYKSLRIKLIKSIGEDNPIHTPIDVIRYAQKILDRILFIAFAEDRGLIPSKTLIQAFNTVNPFAPPKPVWENFKGLFNAIDKGSEQLNIPAYNGGLFADDLELNSLKISDELCEGFKKIGEYDFDSDVSVNILGHIFEQSISDIEDLKAQINGCESVSEAITSKRKQDGIFYTPPYVTNYIVERAIGSWLFDKRREIGFENLPSLTDVDFDSVKLVTKGRGKLQTSHITYNKNIATHITAWEKYKSALSNIKVLDPACGSGAFLNEVFDFIKNEGQKINNELTNLTGQADLFRWDTHILENNIYGIDLNRESVEITKLSLWLKTANKNEKLTYLQNNIKVGNSLVDDLLISTAAFQWEEEFSEILSNGGFDIIVGNPPYIDSEEMAKSQKKERDYIAKQYSTTTGNWDIYIPFFEKSLKLLKSNTSYLSFITPDKWVSKDFGNDFRIKYVNNIQEILILGRDVFDEAKVDSIVTTFKTINNNILETKIFDGKTSSNLNSCEVVNVLKSPYQLDILFSKNFNLINKINSISNHNITSYDMECENACATSDAYDLKDFILNDKVKANDIDFYKVVNTGTLDKFIFKWGFKPMKYLKDSYLYPIVSKKDFNNTCSGLIQQDTFLREY